MTSLSITVLLALIPIFTLGQVSLFGSGGYKFNFGIMGSKNIGDWRGSVGLGVTYHTNLYETDKKGWELRKSVMLSYDDGHQGGSLGSSWWSGIGDSQMLEFNQRTGMMKYQNGDFNIMYENDGAPFGKMKLGDGNDSYRTAALQIGIGHKFHVGFNLFTGFRGKYIDEGEPKDSYKGDQEKVGSTVKGAFNELYPNGQVNEIGPQYRFGGLYLGFGSTRIGINSDRYVRHPIQDRFAHNLHIGKINLTQQPGFQTLSDDILLYWQKRARNPFTTW